MCLVTFQVGKSRLRVAPFSGRIVEFLQVDADAIAVGHWDEGHHIVDGVGEGEGAIAIVEVGGIWTYNEREVRSRHLEEGNDLMVVVIRRDDG